MCSPLDLASFLHMRPLQNRYMDVYSYRDWEAKPLLNIDCVDHSRFPFSRIVDRSDITVTRKKVDRKLSKQLSRRPKDPLLCQMD